MSESSVLLLGTPVWEYDDTALSIPTQKGRALLWYCAANPGRMFTRSHVAGLLWGTFSETDSRNSLNTTLTRLRHMLPIVPLRFASDLIGWDSLSPVRVDLHSYLELASDDDLRRMDHVNGIEQRRQLESAIALWRGSLLEGIEFQDAEGFMQWLEAERIAWDRRLLTAFGRLISLHESMGAWHMVVDHAHHALSIDPLQERFHRAIMRSYHRLGDRAAALGQFSICRDLLSSEHGVDPDPETIALSEQIAGRSEANVPSRATTLPLPAMLSDMAEHTFVGREPLVQRIADLAAAAHTDHVAGVLITGEPGIGKSRLAIETVRRLAAAVDLSPGPWTVLRGACHDEFRDLAYTPFLDILRTAWHGLDDGAAHAHAIHLAALAPLIPALRALLLQEPSSAAQIDEIDSAQRPVLDAALELLGLCQSPLVILLEDLQSADAASLTLLSYLLRRGIDIPSLLIATARSTELTSERTFTLRKLQREDQLTWIHLDAFDITATLSLLREFQPAADMHDAMQMQAATGGNPYFIVETARTLRNVPNATPLSVIPISDGVRSLIADRLSKLSADGRLVLETLSVFTHGTSYDIVRKAAGLSENAFLQAADELIDSDLILEAQGVTEGTLGYGFTHDLCRQCVLSSVSRARRAAMQRFALGPPDGHRMTGL